MILEGMLSVKAALLAGRRKIHKIYIDAERKDREVRFVLHRAEERDVPVAFVSREEIENMTAGKTHGGIAAEAESRVYQDIGDCFTEDTPAAAEEPAPVAEPVAETPAPKAYTKEEVRAILADLSQNGFRNEAKALVRKYSDGGSLTDIDPAKYPDLVAEAEALHG